MIFGRDCVLGRFFFEIPLFPLFSAVSSVSSVFLVKTMFFKETCFFFLKGLEKDTFQGLGNAIDNSFLSTINKILIDKLSIRSFCY